MTTFLRTLAGWTINFCFSVTVFAQSNLSFEVLDSKTGKPISDAFLFIQNSTIGTNTDLQGKASLNVPNLDYYEVVITHINYLNTSVSSKNLVAPLHKISLQPNPVDLQEVVVQTKKRNAKRRKEWMRRFQSEIFGTNIKGSKLKLLNPEAVWFEEKEGTLEAHAIDNLKIENDYMGYQLQLVLDHFSVTVQGDVRYVGKLFFEDVLSQLKNTKSIRKRRAKFYLESKQLFFLSLIHELSINTQQFEFGITTSQGDNTFAYNQSQLDSLNWRYGINTDTLMLTDYLTVINKNLLASKIKMQGNKNGSKPRPITSFLRSTTGRFILDHNGRLLNPLEIEESGYWSDHRIAVELPIDYNGGIQLHSPFRIVDSLAIYANQISPEKVFIHTNKLFFSNREQLWFKGYLVNGISHRPFTQSQVLYVDLINPEQQIIQTWELHTSKGLKGDFQFTRNNDPGTYFLRAYTNFMRNTKDAFFFEQPITVVDFLVNEDLVSEEKEGGNQKLAALSVAFFPEGGDLIAGLTANVAFQIKDQNGLPIETKGYISNEDEGKLLDAKTYHEGVGLFSFIPVQGQAYFFHTTFRDQSFVFPLPKVYPAGMTLHVNATENQELYIEVETTNDELLQNAFLVGHSRGVQFLQKNQLRSGKSIKIPKSKIPTGLLHFTLFDGVQRPQAERLAFNDYGVEDASIQLSELHITEDARSKKTLQIECDSTIIDEMKDVSASIVNMNLNPHNFASNRMKSYFLLNSDLFYSIPNASQYLQEISSVKRFYLDLLLLCQTWRRFKWRSLIDGTGLQISFEPELGYTVAGYTTHKGDSTRVQTEIMLNSLDENIVYKKIRTDEFGHFSFKQLPAVDSTTYFLQARINKDKDASPDGKVKGNRLVDLHLSPRSRAPFHLPQSALFQTEVSPEISEEQRIIYQEKSQTDEQYSTADWTIDLEEVAVTAKRRFSSNLPIKGKLYNMDAVEWIAPEAKGVALLGSLAPRFSFYPGAEGQLMNTYVNRRGDIVTVPVVISIDGMGAEPGGSNALPFLSLPADAIQSIYIEYGAIGVTTRSIPRSRAAYLESGALQYDHPGYYEAREFKLPNYTPNNGHDLRTTVLWNPDVQFDQQGKATLEFDYGPFSNNYRITIAGVSESGEIIDLQYRIRH